MKLETLALLLAVSIAGGCVRQARTVGPRVSSGADPIVSVDAGFVEIQSGSIRSIYLVDRAAHACWFWVYDSPAPMDCCNLRLVAAAAPLITWETDATCPAAPTPPAPPTPPTPAMPAPPSATP